MYTRSRLILFVEPGDAIVEIEGHRVQAPGLVRYLQTPLIISGRQYTYRITALWPDGGRCEREVFFRGGEEVHVNLRPESSQNPKEDAHQGCDRAPEESDGEDSQRGGRAIPNFGLDVSRLQDRQGRAPGQERFLWRGREISRSEALALLAGHASTSANRTLPDDAHLPHLTIVSRDGEVRQRILRDLESAQELNELRRQFRVQSYPADHWIVSRLGLDRDAEFAASGLAIVVQPPAGEQGTSPPRICYRYDGPTALARWLRQESPHPSLPAFPKWVYVLVLAMALWFFLRAKSYSALRSIPHTGGSTMNWLNGYKTYLAALLAAFVAFNHVVPLVTPEVEQAILAAATALGLYGLRHALERLEQSQQSARP